MVMNVADNRSLSAYHRHFVLFLNGSECLSGYVFKRRMDEYDRNNGEREGKINRPPSPSS